MFGADKGTAGELDGKRLHIGIVQARFNEPITDALFKACHAELLALRGLYERLYQLQLSGPEARKIA